MQKLNTTQFKFSSFFVLSLILILFISLWGYYQIYGHYLILDERSHYPQIEIFSQGGWDLYVKPGDKYPENAVFPGYHIFAALFSVIAGSCTPDVIRLFGVFAAFALFMVAYCLSRCFFEPKTALLRAMQVYFLPILFPFYFLIYTDTLSALTFLIAVYFTERKKYTFSAVVACLSVLIRQNSIVFLPFLMLYSYYRDYGIDCSLHILKKFILANWLYFFIIPSFGVFILINGRITLNAPSSHPPVLSIGNIIFSVICCCFFFLPEIFLRRKGIVQWTQRHKIITWLVVFSSLYVFFYYPAHKWNQIPWLIRNEIINWFVYDIYTRTILFALTAISILSICSQTLINKGAYLMYPFWGLMLLPALLVEPRYYIIPFLLFIVFREKLSFLSEILVLIYFVFLSLLIHIVHTHSVFVI